MKLSLLFPPLLAIKANLRTTLPSHGACSTTARSRFLRPPPPRALPGGCASFRLKQLQGSYPNRPAGRQTDAQARKHADKPLPGQEASEQTRKQAGQAGRTARRQATGKQTSRTRNKPTYRKVPPRKKKRCQQQPEYPQTSGSTYYYQRQPEYPQTPGSASQTNIQESHPPQKKRVAVPKAAPASADTRIYLTNQHAGKSPQKRKETPSKAARVSADPGAARASADPAVYLRDQHTGKSPNKKTRYQKAARISADPAVCLRGRHTGKSKKRQRNAAQKWKQEPTKASQSIHRPRRDSDPAGLNPATPQHVAAGQSAC